jgi:hypothetical protein
MNLEYNFLILSIKKKEYVLIFKVKQEWYKKERKAKLSEETFLQTQKKRPKYFLFRYWNL